MPTVVAQGLLTTASKTNGGYAYNFATVPLLAEALKLAISAALLQRQRRTQPEAARTTRGWRTAALFLVPSIIYWLHNNVQFFTLRRAPSLLMNPHPFPLLCLPVPLRAPTPPIGHTRSRCHACLSRSGHHTAALFLVPSVIYWAHNNVQSSPLGMPPPCPSTPTRPCCHACLSRSRHQGPRTPSAARVHACHALGTMAVAHSSEERAGPAQRQPPGQTTRKWRGDAGWLAARQLAAQRRRRRRSEV